MTVEDVVKAYDEELNKWNFFSDSQFASYDGGYIKVCLRNYNWYVTKEKITDPLTAVKALNEIDWIAEYDDEGTCHFIDSSVYWSKS